MAVFVTVAWGIMVLVSNLIEKKSKNKAVSKDSVEASPAGDLV